MIEIKIIRGKDDIKDAQEVRKQVFQAEQGIGEKLDFDGFDGEADHFVAYSDGSPVGTLRVRYLQEKTAKLERLAVLKVFRGAGIGRQLLDFVINYLKQKAIYEISLDSQEQAKGFYEKAGFMQRGEVFEEVGISHIKMYKKL